MSLPTDNEYGLDAQGRHRFYGIYSAIVVSNSDPLNRNRLQIQIPQIHGSEVSNWVPGCFPITDNSYHPDHNPHTAAQIAALLTTSTASASGSDPQGGTVTVSIPALTVVAKSGAGQLNHAHQTAHPMVNPKTNLVASAPISTATDTLEKSAYTAASGVTAPGTTSTGVTTPEHTFHRLIPAVGQLIWVMFQAGDPEYPVWIGVQ